MNEIKRMNGEHQDEMFQLAAYAFNAETTDKRKERFQKIVQHSWNYGYFSNNILASQVISTPFTVNFHKVNYQMAGIGCVSSYPEYRGQGGVSAIMKQLLTDLAQNKIELAYLAPFSYPFYRKYGFEQLFEQITYTIQAADWPNIKAIPGQMKRVPFEVAQNTIQEIYQKIERNQRGALTRENWWLEYTFGLDQANQFAIYKNEQDEIEGYLIYQLSAARFTIKEWGYLTNQAFKSILRFVGSHNGSSQEFHFETGFDGQTLSYLLPAPLVKMEISPYMMGRIVDLESFLEKYPFATGANESYYLEIEDRYASWNDGLWKLSINNQGKATLLKIDSLPQDDLNENTISGDIQTITQAFMGYRSLAELRFYEKISANETLIKALDKRLVKGVPVLADYF